MNNQRLKPREERLCSIEEVARRLGLSAAYIRLQLREGNIKGVKLGIQWKVSESEMLRIMKEGLKPVRIIPNTKKTYGRKPKGIIA